MAGPTAALQSHLDFTFGDPVVRQGHVIRVPQPGVRYLSQPVLALGGLAVAEITVAMIKLIDHLCFVQRQIPTAFEQEYVAPQLPSLRFEFVASPKHPGIVTHVKCSSEP